MAEQANGQAADAAGQAQAQTQGGAAAAGDPATDLATLREQVARLERANREIADDRKVLREKLRAREQGEADAAAKRGEFEPLLKQRDEALAEATRRAEAAEAGAARLRVQRAFDAQLTASGIPASEITEAWLDTALSKGRIRLDGDAMVGIDEAVAALAKHLPAAGGQRAAQSTGPAAPARPSYATLKPGELASLPDAEQRRIVAEATTSTAGGMRWPSLHGPK